MQNEESLLAETISIQQFLSLTGESGIKSLAAKQAAIFLEQILQVPIRVALPYSLVKFGIKTIPALLALKKLQKIGYLTQEALFFQSYPDEPLIFRASLGGNSGGSDLFDIGKCLWKATAEYVERKTWRSSGEWYQSKIIKGSQRSIGKKALDLQTIAGFSSTQREKNHRLKIEPEKIFGWVPTTSLVSSKKIYAPTQLFSSHYARTESGKKEPLIRWPVSTGLATNPNLSGAIVRGALEVIERDAFMITFLNQLSPPRINLENLKEARTPLGDFLQSIKKYRLEIHLLRLPTDFPIPTIAAIIIDRSNIGPAFSMGAKADFDEYEAIVGALSEALSVRHSTKQVPIDSIPDSLPFSSFKREERINYWLSPTRLPRLNFLLKGPIVDTNAAPNLYTEKKEREKKGEYEEKLANLKEIFRKNECELLYVELTPKEIREVLDFRIIYAVSPQMQPMHLDETYPCIGGERIYKVPLKLGYSPAKKLNPDPHPFP